MTGLFLLAFAIYMFGISLLYSIRKCGRKGAEVGAILLLFGGLAATTFSTMMISDFPKEVQLVFATMVGILTLAFGMYLVKRKRRRVYYYGRDVV